jgi:hypothetical protein
MYAYVKDISLTDTLGFVDVKNKICTRMVPVTGILAA